MLNTREDLHKLVEAIPEHRAVLAKRLLQALIEEDRDVDSEPLTPEDLKAIQEAEARMDRGEYVEWEQAKKELRLDDHGV